MPVEFHLVVFAYHSVDCAEVPVAAHKLDTFAGYAGVHARAVGRFSISILDEILA